MAIQRNVPTTATVRDRSGAAQRQLYNDVSRKLGEQDRLFFEMKLDTQPDLVAKLIERRPELWGRYHGFAKPAGGK